MDEEARPSAPPSATPVASKGGLPSFLRGRTGAIVVLVVVGVLAAAFLVFKAASTHVIKGSITLQAGIADYSIQVPDNPEAGDPCLGLGGYSDMQAGTEVTVKDEDGTLLASGSLREGTLDEVVEDVLLFCKFPFTIEDVPRHKVLLHRDRRPGRTELLHGRNGRDGLDRQLQPRRYLGSCRGPFEPVIAQHIAGSHGRAALVIVEC